MKSFSILFTESVKEVEDLNEQIQLLDEMPGANMDTRAVHKHLKKQGWSLTRSSGGHDVFTHPEAKHHIPVPRHRQLKAPLVRGILKQSQVNEESKGLWANIHAKRERIKNGSGERMRKPGSEGAPSEEDLKNSQVKEDTLQEGRPSQRHPLEGHEYHKKTDAELEYIAKDAHKAAEAMKSHNTAAENKYRDQANDSATVRYFRKKNGMPNWYKKKYGHIKEDNVINTNTPNSVLNNPATQTNVTKKKQVIDRYTTGKSSAVSGTTVVASPRESVEIQEGRMKSMADDDFHPTITKSAPPFDGPYKTKPKDVKDKSGAIHTPMSRARNLARQAARKNGGLKENNDNTLSSYDKDDTPAKQTLSKTAGMVKNLAKDAKAKAKTKTTNDKFQPEPELNSNIVR
jgi:predicted RNA binding protein YcfA (HicA-like mRNA interferase family)